MSAASEWRDFDRRVENNARPFAVIWMTWIQILRQEISRSALTTAIRTGKPEAAIRSVPREFWAPRNVSLLKANANARYADGGMYGAIRDMLLEILGEASNAEAAKLGLPFRFDLENPYAVDWASQQAATLVSTWSEEMVVALREAIVDAFDAGIPPQKAMEDILDTGLGLTRLQREMVTNFTTRLQRSGKVLIPNWEGMSQSARDKAVAVRTEAYYGRKVKERALMIARTETIQALNEGTRQSWLVARDQGLLDPEAERTWLASVVSLRTCAICRGLHGRTAPLDGPFVGPDGEHMNPPAHPKCRCRTVIAFMLDIEPLSDERLEDLNAQAAEFRQAAADRREERLRNLRFLRATPTPAREMRSIPGYTDNVRAR